MRERVPRAQGGDGRGPGAAIGIVAQLAERSLAAAFVFWAQRACIECLRHGADPVLAERLLPALLEGTLAGAPALSNAMKFLGGLDRLRVTVTETETETAAETAAARGVRLCGDVPWATNLHPQGFVALLAAGHASDGGAAVYAVAHDAAGLVRAPDLDLAALRGTSTGALRLDDVAVAVSDASGAAPGRAWCVHPDARTFLPAVRPLFVGLQCGLGHGLARAALRAARAASGGLPGVLAMEADALESRLDADWRQLAAGIDDGSLRGRPRDLLALRLRAVELADAAVRLELQGLGGRALLRGRDGGFGRRLREAAFLAVLTPTLVQLKNDLARG
jgi:alkylation response protein AidB-like acyl-CoA dehydrogenase